MGEELIRLTAALKQKYGEPLYALELGDTLYVFRPLTAIEYAILTRAGLTEPEDICRAAVVWPEVEDWESVRAGDPDKLARAVLDLSGLGSKDVAVGLLEAFREEMNTFQGQAQALIAFAFPHLSLEEIASMPLETLLLYLSRAEWILKNLHGINVEIQLQGEEKKEPDKKERQETVRKLREQGVDPMLALYKPPRRDRNWVDQPVILGTRRWREWSPSRKDDAGETQ